MGGFHQGGNLEAIGGNRVDKEENVEQLKQNFKMTPIKWLGNTLTNDHIYSFNCSKLCFKPLN